MTKVTYILGAGLTHAAAAAVDKSALLLTKHITTEMIIQIGRSVTGSKLKNFRMMLGSPIPEKFDVEQVISLFESSGLESLQKEAKELKKLFQNILRTKLKPFESGFNPDLLAALFDRHNVPEIGETINGVITLNYDAFTERALKLACKDKKLDFLVTAGRPNESRIPFIKLHGSLDWTRGIPVHTTRRAKVPLKNSFWVAPSLSKSLDSYPFNILLGRAREVLQCDRIRVIGCALGRNDWHLIRLLFEVNWLDRRSPIPMEIIGPPDLSHALQKEYPFLRVIGPKEMPFFARYVLSNRLSRALPPGVPLSSADLEAVEKSLNEEKANVADEWVRSEYGRLRFASANTSAAKYLTDYMDKMGA